MRAPTTGSSCALASLTTSAPGSRHSDGTTRQSSESRNAAFSAPATNPVYSTQPPTELATAPSIEPRPAMRRRAEPAGRRRKASIRVRTPLWGASWPR